jgi:hypothetical protein
MPTQYFVQVAESTAPGVDGGWQTRWVSLDRSAAEQMAASQESAKVSVDGQDISASSVSIARVVTSDELLMGEGVDAYVAALSTTRVNLQQQIDALPE